MEEKENLANEIVENIEHPKKGGHPARSPKFRAETGYLSARHTYYSKYYQRNKEKLAAKKKERYKDSPTLRDYHRKKSNEYYLRHRVKTGARNRTIMTAQDGQRLYSINHAANAIGFSVAWFRDLIRKGIIPDASFKSPSGWRLYSAGQIKLLKKAMIYYHQYTNPNRTQAVLFCFWNDPEAVMTLDSDRILKIAMKAMEKKTNAGTKQIQLKE